MVCLLYTTWPDRDTAQTASHTLLQEKLIACANQLSPSQSIYEWKGEICTDDEVVVLFKTDLKIADQVRDRLLKLHPYDEPCILCLPVHDRQSSKGFIDWIKHQTLPT